MDLDLGWLLWALPLAFALGWLASRLDLRQLRQESRRAPKAYFRGLNHLLNEQQDQAIDAFIEAVQNDPDTSELHFALGNLFRRRGDYDRAVRVHEHLLSRDDLATRDRERAQHALALDFLKAGLLDRAETALKRLEGTAFETEARLALLGIYERSRDWARASDLAAALEGAGHGSFRLRRAHHRCELALQQRASGHDRESIASLRALTADTPDSARAWALLADALQQAGDTAGALESLAGLARHCAGHLPLVAHALAQWSIATGQIDDATALLEQQAERLGPSLDITQALADLDAARGRAAGGSERYLAHLRLSPSLVAASRWLEPLTVGNSEQDALVKAALRTAAEPLKRYRCAACGFEARQYFWHCPGCQTWDSYPPRRIEEL